MTGTAVNVTNFERAETDRMFAAIQAQAGGVNQLFHNRVPTPVDRQTVIRMNRDTLYSGAVVDISAGATIVVPDAGRRYLSVMIVNQDHHINRVFHKPGHYDLTVEGSVTIHFGGCDDDRPNCLPITDGWNYVVRLYRPRAEILDGTWAFPTLEPAR
jgi:hypothetical protein